MKFSIVRRGKSITIYVQYAGDTRVCGVLYLQPDEWETFQEILAATEIEVRSEE